MMTIPENLLVASDQVVRMANALGSHTTGVQVILETTNTVEARAVACEVGRTLDESGPIPLFVLRGADFEDHHRLFSDQSRDAEGELLPADRRLVLLIEDFDQVLVTHQRAYAHLIDGDDPQNQLAAGSLLLLHVPTASAHELEPGTLDRGVIVSVVE